MRRTPKDDMVEFVKIHTTEKSGQSLQLTKKRAIMLKKYLQDLGEGSLKIGEYEIFYKDIKFKNASSNTDEITFPILDNILSDKMKIECKINEEAKCAYNEFLNELLKSFGNNIRCISQSISKLDVLYNKSYLACKNNYCKPIINNENGNSFVDFKELRHPLIEKIQTKELYVTNDMNMGINNKHGVLLYGTNAVGKTSFIRAIGSAVIFAQAGMYVAASNFIYKPYSAIYSRIIGNDNLFKGLSTFEVEISELRVILKMADQNSLILGDELCSGTENESACSIFTAALKYIHEKKSSFIFATHLHEITNWSDITSLSNLKLYHMHVYYDHENECLVYDRKLKEGSGTRMYGLEVCKNMYLSKEFMDDAYSIRNNYFPEQKGVLSGKRSRYNSKKIVHMCEICKHEPAIETHHINQQKDASENGYINSFHKNHPANLKALCESCHTRIHHQES